MILLKINFLKLKNADAIIHCATTNNIISKNFEAGFNLSVMGTKKILDAAVKAKIKNVIFFFNNSSLWNKFKRKYKRKFAHKL